MSDIEQIVLSPTRSRSAPATWGQISQYLSHKEARVETGWFVSIDVDVAHYSWTLAETELRIVLLIDRIPELASFFEINDSGQIFQLSGSQKPIFVDLIRCSSQLECEQSSQNYPRRLRFPIEDLFTGAARHTIWIYRNTVYRIRFEVPHVFIDAGSRDIIVQALVEGVSPSGSSFDLGCMQAGALESQGARAAAHQVSAIASNAGWSNAGRYGGAAKIISVRATGTASALRDACSALHCSPSALILSTYAQELELHAGGVGSISVDFSNRGRKTIGSAGCLVQPVFVGVRHPLNLQMLNRSLLGAFRYGMYPADLARSLLAPGTDLPRVFMNDLVEWRSLSADTRLSERKITHCHTEEGLSNDFYSDLYLWIRAGLETELLLRVVEAVMPVESGVSLLIRMHERIWKLASQL